MSGSPGGRGPAEDSVPPVGEQARAGQGRERGVYRRRGRRLLLRCPDRPPDVGTGRSHHSRGGDHLRHCRCPLSSIQPAALSPIHHVDDGSGEIPTEGWGGGSSRRRVREGPASRRRAARRATPPPRPTWWPAPPGPVRGRRPRVVPARRPGRWRAQGQRRPSHPAQPLGQLTGTDGAAGGGAHLEHEIPPRPPRSRAGDDHVRERGDQPGQDPAVEGRRTGSLPGGCTSADSSADNTVRCQSAITGEQVSGQPGLRVCPATDVRTHTRRRPT